MLAAIFQVERLRWWWYCNKPRRLKRRAYEKKRAREFKIYWPEEE
jgi:hypothetical protein